MATDGQCRAAIKAMEEVRIQGFSYGKNFGPPYVVRDVYRSPDKQELWRGDDHEAMIERCAIERMRLALDAALSLSPG